MLELLAQVDPLAAVMAGVWLFAAGMIPVGIMLGSSCSPCCGGLAPCSECTEGELPETLTVSFGNFPEQEPGNDLATLSFSACYGNGASGKVTAPGGTAGQISAVSLTSGGSGYAKLGRVQPTLTITGDGSGATLTPTLTAAVDACGLDYWQLASVTASGGSGYTNGGSLTVSVASGDTEQQAAAAKLYVDRSAPTLTIGGTATGTITTAPQEDFGYLVWVPQSATVTDGGSGYSEGGAVTIVLGTDDVADVAGYPTARVVHDQPSPTISVDSIGGSGAQLTVVWELVSSGQWPAAHKKTYRVVSVTVDDGGSGYSQYDQISISFSGIADGQVVEAAYLDVESVDGNGAITAVFVSPADGNYVAGPAGLYVGSQTDALHSVDFSNSPGFYHKASSGTHTVVVNSGGYYFREDSSLTPYTASVSVSIAQASPSNGSGAQIAATVNSTVGHPDFGKITGLTITNGGSGYLAYSLVNRKCCGQYYNGLSVVMKRLNYNNSDPCRYDHQFCGVGNTLLLPGSVSLTYTGPATPPTLQLYSEIPQQDDTQSTLCNTLFTAASNVTDCGSWESVVFESAGGATATVTAGGGYDPTYRNPGANGCFICCHGEGPMAEEVEFDIAGGQYDGVYVGAAYGGFDPANRYGWTTPLAQGIFIYADLSTCATQFPDGWVEPPPQGPYNPPCEENNCHTTCNVRVYLQNSSGTFAQSQWCNCETTPKCDPYGEYAVDSYTVTVRAPL